MRLPWTLELVRLFLREISVAAQRRGFGVGLTGSVLLTGMSNNDLDLVMYPRCKSALPTDWNRARRALLKVGATLLYDRERVRQAWAWQGSQDTKHVEVWLYNNRRIDVFFLE